MGTETLEKERRESKFILTFLRKEAKSPKNEGGFEVYEKGLK